jgi:hypothetical protein
MNMVLILRADGLSASEQIENNLSGLALTDRCGGPALFARFDVKVDDANTARFQHINPS